METLLGLLIITLLAYIIQSFGEDVTPSRRFIIDEDSNRFLMDGKPFRYVSGSFHYFRAMPGAWQRILRQMRLGGLNAVDTYVEWSLHNPEDNVYHWFDMADIEKFLQLAQQENLYVILRPGPYICAERDNGGIPYWLFTKYPKIQLRTYDENYIYEVTKWYAMLMPRLQPYLYGNGGPIILVQIENEYGGFHTCDRTYLNWLRDETLKYVENKAVLFTTDIPNDNINCGKIDNVLATTDFGIDRMQEIDDIWKLLRTVQPKGPLVNSEFYTGWLTHWQEPNQRRNAEEVAYSLRTILSYNASVNMYMYFGGTNYGFTAGANDWGIGNYTSDITSYDYDAVIDEAGNVTQKFFLIRDVINEFLPIESTGLIDNNEPKDFGLVHLNPVLNLLSPLGKQALAKDLPITISQSIKTKTFEELQQFSGLILYETILSTFEIDPTLLTVNNLRDRAYVYLCGNLMGVLSRENNIYSMPLTKIGTCNVLQLLVENQGRINYYVANDTKGILGPVTIQQRSGIIEELQNWNHTLYPLSPYQIQKLFNRLILKELKVKGNSVLNLHHNLTPNHGPIVYYGEFYIQEVADTHLNTYGWGKGQAFINGFNLGRYWPLVGPQITLYVPKEILNSGRNSIILLEYQQANTENHNGLAYVYLEKYAQLDGADKMRNNKNGMVDKFISTDSGKLM